MSFKLHFLLLAIFSLASAGCTVFTDPDEYNNGLTFSEDAMDQTDMGLGDEISDDPSVCQQMCDRAMSTCKGDDTIYEGDLDYCLSFCNDLAVGSPDDTIGDTQQCRLYHVTLAAGDPAVHCPHASEEGANVCVGPAPVDPCSAHCASYGDLCPGEFTGFGTNLGERLGECKRRCDQLSRGGQGGDVIGNSLQCHQSYLMHLMHGGYGLFLCQAAAPQPNGTAACNDDPDNVCEAICGYTMDRCESSSWSDLNACLDQCNTRREAGMELPDPACYQGQVDNGECTLGFGGCLE